MYSFEIKNRRLAEPSQNKECTCLAGQALDNHEGTTFKHTPQYQLSQKLNQKINQPSFQGSNFKAIKKLPVSTGSFKLFSNLELGS